MTFRMNPEWRPRTMNEAKRRMAIAGTVTRDNVRDLIDDPGDGVQYPGQPNPASKPGDPPAIQKGRLHESIRVSEVAESPAAIEVHVGSFAERAPILEAGTASLAPRPFLAPGMYQSRPDILKAIGGQGG